MHLAETEQQTAARSTAARLAAEVVAPGAVDNDSAARFPTDILEQLAAHGLMGVNVSRERGGLAAGVIAYSLAVTEIASADPAVAVTMCVNNMVAEVIEHFGTDYQCAAYLPSMMNGEFVSGSFCLSEAGAGSDPRGMRTTATRTAHGWVINGTKAWITSGAYSRGLVVWAKTGDDEITAFLVDGKSEGISTGKPERKLGQHASNTVTVSFDDVEVAADAVLGNIGDGFKIAMMALDGGRVGIASQSLGIARSALGYVERHKHPALFAQFEAARLLTLRAAWLKETGAKRFSREASMAKLHASELAARICAAAFDTVGALALDQNHPVAKLFRDARVTRIYEGTNEIQRVVIAREVQRNGVLGGAA